MGSIYVSLFPRLQNGTISPPTRLQETLKMKEAVHGGPSTESGFQ